MDGLSALSVAASVAQFIELSCSLITKTKEIYSSTHGTLLQQVEIESATKRLVELSSRIRASASLQTGPNPSVITEDQALTDICQGCLCVSNQLLSKLNTLKVADGQRNRGYKSFRQALKSVWSKRDIDDLAERLNVFRRDLDAHVLVSLSERFNSLTLLQDERFVSLDETLRRIIEPLLRELVTIHKTLLEKDNTPRSTRARTMILRAPVAQFSGIEMYDCEEKADLVLLEALRFPAMSYRHLEITEAHQKTFSWIFEASHSSDDGTGPRIRPWSNFAQWLQEGSGIYWINGKAGSGKSTLMRYISDHPQTQLHLSTWCRNANLQVSSFYFWNSGTPLQRSQIGLLQGLLYDILHRRPDLIRSVFASDWESIRAVVAKSLRIPECQFSQQRLEEAFISLSNLTSEDLMICLFVDGLDEYDGDPEILTNLFTIISKSPYIKICLSSRPWLVFEEAFEGCPGLRLQDLTWNDIRCYVRDKLETNPRMEYLKQVNAAGSDMLARTITEKANGVFLWVYIVTKSLLSGLRNHDSISDLERRLEVLPSNLDALYSHMIGRIDALYIEQASRIFQIYDAMTSNDWLPTILELELTVTADYSSSMAPPSLMTQLEIEERCRRMAAHLKSRCEGLLEVHDFHDRHWESVTDTKLTADHLISPIEIADTVPCQEEEAETEKRLKINCKVSYLHRTVKDFLKADVVRSKLEQSTSFDKSFDPNFSLLMSYVLNLKRSLRTLNFFMAVHDERIRRTTISLIMIVQKIDRENDKYADVLHEFFQQTCHWWMSPSSPLNLRAPSYEEWQAEFLSLAAWSGLWKYIDKCLGNIENPLRVSTSTSLLPYALGLDRPPPHLAVNKYFYITTPRRKTDPKMMQILLRHGGDPNGLYEIDHTIWQCFLHQIMKEMSTPSDSQALMYFHILKILLQYGTGPAPCDENSSCRIYRTFKLSLSIESVINDVFSARLPAEADLLRAAMRKEVSMEPRKHRSEHICDQGQNKRLRLG